MGPFSAIGRSLLTRRVSARRQEAEDSREENGIPTPAIGANATNFHHPGAGSVQITKKASPWAGLLCFVFPLLETAEKRGGRSAEPTSPVHFRAKSRINPPCYHEDAA